MRERDEIALKFRPVVVQGIVSELDTSALQGCKYIGGFDMIPTYARNFNVKIIKSKHHLLTHCQAL